MKRKKSSVSRPKKNSPPKPRHNAQAKAANRKRRVNPRSAKTSGSTIDNQIMPDQDHLVKQKTGHDETTLKTSNRKKHRVAWWIAFLAASGVITYVMVATKNLEPLPLLRKVVHQLAPDSD